jgi:hypothetical protein
LGHSNDSTRVSQQIAEMCRFRHIPNNCTPLRESASVGLSTKDAYRKRNNDLTRSLFRYRQAPGRHLANESAMSVTGEILCNHALLGAHRGEIHQTQSLRPVFPGAAYEITARGWLELLVCTYEDRSAPMPRVGRGWRVFDPCIHRLAARSELSRLALTPGFWPGQVHGRIIGWL